MRVSNRGNNSGFDLIGQSLAGLVVGAMMPCVCGPGHLLHQELIGTT
jgi:hypothetical protein